MNRRSFFGLLAGTALFALTKTTGLAKLAPRIDKPVYADVQFGTNLSLDDFEQRILQPAIEAMAKRFDEEMARMAFS